MGWAPLTSQSHGMVAGLDREGESPSQMPKEGLPWWRKAKTPRSQCRGPEFDPWLGD